MSFCFLLCILMVPRSPTAFGASAIGKRQRPRTTQHINFIYLFTIDIPFSFSIVYLVVLLYLLFPFIFFMDLIPYCAILFSNILTVAEAHRKHVPQTNPNCTVLLFLPWFNNGDMFGKKKKKERGRGSSTVPHGCLNLTNLL